MSLWSDEQRRMLVAMGFAVYARNDGSALASVAVVSPETKAASPVTAEPRVGDDRLMRALQRAAAGRDVLAVVGDLESLRRDPQRKRALWPKLRALRRRH